MIRHGMKIYEYKKNVLHGKVAVADEMQMTIGSYNVNDISAYASIELNLDIRHVPTATDLHNSLQKIILEDCEQITETKHRKRTYWFIQLLRWASYELVRAMIYLTTFYFKKQV
jgi:cardiolipin synthase